MNCGNVSYGAIRKDCLAVNSVSAYNILPAQQVLAIKYHRLPVLDVLAQL